MMRVQVFLEKFELDVPYNGKISTTIGPITNYGEFTCGSISGMFLDLNMRDSENLSVEARTYIGSGYRIEKGAYAGAAIIDYYDNGRLVRTERR